MVLIMDGKTPNGRRLIAKRNHSVVSPCITRQMTEEEKAFYGEPALRKKSTPKKVTAKREKPKTVKPQKPRNRNLPKDPDFAEKIRAERERLGMTRVAFSKMVGVPASTIESVEKCLYGLRESTKEKICKALGWVMTDV